MDDLTERDLAEQVLTSLPNGTKNAHGSALLRLIEQHDINHVNAWRQGRLIASLGRYVSDVRADLERQRQAERDLTYGVASSTGLPISPTLSVKTDEGRQLLLWYRASPRQFIDAVLREQQVVDGRHSSNALRMQVVQLLLDHEELMDLPTLEDVCKSLELNPQSLDLDSLEAASA